MLAYFGLFNIGLWGAVVRNAEAGWKGLRGLGWASEPVATAPAEPFKPAMPVFLSG